MPKPTPYTAADGTTTWRVRFRHRGRQTSETFATERAATAFIRVLEAHGAHTAVRLRDEETAPKGDALDDVFEQYATHKRGIVRDPRTVDDYEATWRNHISPAFGDRPIDSLTEPEVQRWVDQLPGAPKSIRGRHVLLKSLYTWAMLRGYATTNPCTTTVLPKITKKPPKALREAEWAAFYRALRQVNQDAADLALFMHGTGWRWGEATALSAHDVEDYGDRLFVTVTHVFRRDTAGKVHRVEDAKSRASFRRIAVDAEVADVIRARLPFDGSNRLVFTTQTGKPWNYGHFRDRYWDVARDKVAQLERKPTPHWLRHTHATWLLMAGVPVTEVQRRLGHENITVTTGTYGTGIMDVTPAGLEAFAAIRAGRQALAGFEQSAAIAGEVVKG